MNSAAYPAAKLARALGLFLLLGSSQSAVAQLSQCQQRFAGDAEKIVFEHLEIDGNTPEGLVSHAEKVMGEELRIWTSKKRWLQIRLINCWATRGDDPNLVRPPHMGDFKDADFLERLDDAKVRAYIWGRASAKALRLEYAYVPMMREDYVSAPHSAVYGITEDVFKALEKVPGPILFGGLGAARAKLAELRRSTNPTPIYDAEEGCWPDAIVSLLNDLESVLEKAQLHPIDATRIRGKLAGYRKSAIELARKDHRCRIGMN